MFSRFISAYSVDNTSLEQGCHKFTKPGPAHTAVTYVYGTHPLRVLYTASLVQFQDDVTREFPRTRVDPLIR